MTKSFDDVDGRTRELARRELRRRGYVALDAARKKAFEEFCADSELDETKVRALKIISVACGALLGEHERFTLEVEKMYAALLGKRSAHDHSWILRLIYEGLHASASSARKHPTMTLDDIAGELHALLAADLQGVPTKAKLAEILRSNAHQRPFGVVQCTVVIAGEMNIKATREAVKSAIRKRK